MSERLSLLWSGTLNSTEVYFFCFGSITSVAEAVPTAKSIKETLFGVLHCILLSIRIVNQKLHETRTFMNGCPPLKSYSQQRNYWEYQ